VKGLEPVTDVSVADWVAPRLTCSFGRVSTTVPGGFAAYARVLHPVDDEATWAEVCSDTGATAHALMQWHRICGAEPGEPIEWWGEAPQQGDLEPDVLEALLRVLGGFTEPGMSCLHALWDGYGWVGPSESPRLRLPHRSYLLFRGELAAAAELGGNVTPDWFLPHSPNLLWPEDRSWCVATEVDYDSTLVGGSVPLVAAVLAAPDLEAWPVGPDDDLSVDGDQVNS
jgi:hypothetical protein